MGGFRYRGYSTDDILDTPLMLASFDGASNVVGTETEQITGETTVTRFIPNEYGVKKSKLEVSYGLVKKNGKTFSNAEQTTIERWLTSPKFSSDLVVYDDCTSTDMAIYTGIFTHTEWVPGGDGWIGMTFTFMNNHPYAKKHYEYNFNITPPANGEAVPDDMIISVDESNITHYVKNFRVECPSDELEEYVYPVVTIQALERNETIRITQHTDDENYLQINPLRDLITIMDCEHCLLRDQTTSGIMNFSDIGLRDVGNIYWMRLLPGLNIIRISTTGECNVGISFDAPDKNAGGWP